MCSRRRWLYPLIPSLNPLGLPVNDSLAKVVKLYRNVQGFNVGLSMGITEKGGIEDKLKLRIDYGR